MLKRLNFFVSLFLLLSVFAQAQVVEKEAEKDNWAPKDLTLGLDLSQVVNTLANSGVSIYEVEGQLGLNRYFIVSDFGVSNYSLSDSADYNGSGVYGRIGMDVNFNYKKREKSDLFFGIRYGYAFFSEDLNGFIDDPYYGSIPFDLENNNMTARWFEMDAGLRVKVWKEFSLGYTVRFKFARKAKGDNAFSTYIIPGYGDAIDKSQFGFSYYVYYTIPFQGKP